MHLPDGLSMQRISRRVVRFVLELSVTQTRSSAMKTLPFILAAVKAYVTVGEICQAFRDVYGSWTETSVI